MGAPQEEYIWWGSLADTERMQIFNKAYARVNNVVKSTNCICMLILPSNHDYVFINSETGGDISNSPVKEKQVYCWPLSE